MTKPFLLFQLSDPHLGGTWGPVDPAANWRAAIAWVAESADQPDAILVSGDLTDHGGDAEYAMVRAALEELDAPTYVLAGNHDNRRQLREHFDVPGEGDEPVHYTVDLGPLRLVVLDTTRPGQDAGGFEGRQLDWLESELSQAPDQVTILAMHHPPFATAMPAWDAIGLDPSDRVALAEVIRRHPQILRMLAGHVHAAITAELAGCVAISAPSTYLQARPHFDARGIEFSDDPPAFSVHAVRGTDVVSYVQRLAVPE